MTDSTVKQQVVRKFCSRRVPFSLNIFIGSCSPNQSIILIIHFIVHTTRFLHITIARNRSFTFNNSAQLKVLFSGRAQRGVGDDPADPSADPSQREPLVGNIRAHLANESLSPGSSPWLGSAQL
eukprot:9466306-Pyramimonas_sp.AAC.1